MTDNEFIKAWDILCKLDFFGQRAGRELWNEKPVDVQNEDIENSSRDIAFLKDYISRQNTEIKRLKTENAVILKQSLAENKTTATAIMAETKQHMMTAEYIKRLREEIERLQNILLSFTSKVITWGNKKGYDTTELSLITILDEVKNAKAEIKAEAYKEFAERLKHFIIPQKADGYTREIILKRDIDNLVKEMVGDDNA